MSTTLRYPRTRMDQILVVVGLFIVLIGLWVGMIIVGNTQKQYEECLKVQTVEYCEDNYTFR